MPYTRLEIAELLMSDRPFHIYSACHDISWPATEEDRRRLFSLIKPADVLVKIASSASALTIATSAGEPALRPGLRK